MTESDVQPPPPPGDGAVFRCPHCGHSQLVHIRGGEVVTIYKCPSCGELVAPAKKERS